MVDRIKPQIFIPNEGSKSLIDVKLESHDNFDIYWYHWPQDGFFPVEDYEPVILVYSSGNMLYYLIVRRHWQYQFYNVDELLIPIQVLFDGSFHPPFPKLKQDEDFDKKKARLIPKYYDVVRISTSDIDAKFRTGKGHPTSLGRTMEDPADVANEIYSEHCKGDSQNI